MEGHKSFPKKKILFGTIMYQLTLQIKSHFSTTYHWEGRLNWTFMLLRRSSLVNIRWIVCLSLYVKSLKLFKLVLFV